MPDTFDSDLDPGRLYKLEDPLPALLELQVQDPIHWSSRYGAWMITRYDDVRAGLADARLSPRRAMPDPSRMDPGFAQAFADYKKYLDLWVVVRDPPDHTRLRGLVNKGLTPTAIEALRPQVVRIVDDLLRAMPEKGEVDLVPAFAYPLPAEVIAELIGVPRSALDDLQRWSDGLASSTSMGAKDHFSAATTAAVEMAEYLKGVIAARRQTPGTAIIDKLIAAHEGDDRLSHDELISNLILFLFAGHETTTNLMSNGMRRLLQTPAQLADLRTHLGNRDVVKNTIEEILRYEGALFISMRVCLQPFEWRGKQIKAGDRVFLYHLSANRDPSVFVDAEKFDIRRTDASKHIAFGYGIHFCLGAPLARMEMEIALPALLARYPKIAIADSSVQWKDNLVLRGPKSLRLHLG